MSKRAKTKSRSVQVLHAKPTSITAQVVDCTVDHLALRVQLRAATLGLRLADVAALMGISQSRFSKVTQDSTMTRDMFQRLDAALGQPDWTTPLELPAPISREKMLEKLRANIR